MATALYRISSGEVLKISLVDQPFDDADSTYFGVLTDPTLTDGSAYVDSNGDLRVLTFSKIANVGGNEIHNATQGEIDGFAAFEASDESEMDAERAQALADVDPIFRKIFKALMLRIIDEVFVNTNTKVNTFIDQWETFKADVAVASNLADVKASVAGMSAVASDLKETVTLQAAVNALKGDILGSN